MEPDNRDDARQAWESEYDQWCNSEYDQWCNEQDDEFNAAMGEVNNAD